MVDTLEWGLQNLDGVGSYIDVPLMYHQCSWLLHWCTIGAPPMELALTLEPGITKTSMVFALTLMYGQCTTDGVGSYIGIKIKKTSIILAFALVYHRWGWLLHWSQDYKNIDGVCSYIDVWPMYH